MALIPVFTFYVNTDDPADNRKLAIVGKSPLRDLNVVGVIEQPEIAGALATAVGKMVQETAALGFITNEPVPGYESLFPAAKGTDSPFDTDPDKEMAA